ncbi:hypothetical protein JF55_05180 [Pseudomonas sp. 1-7]|nr:hypothetical protein JF55_05180 [Pseudomonas sp. 1-7]
MCFKPSFHRTSVQLCIVHMVRHCLNYAFSKRRAEVVVDLKRIYQSSTAGEAELRLGEFEAKWDYDYLPMISPGAATCHE